MDVIDSRHIESDGLGFTVTIEPDPDINPEEEEYDCYSPSDIAAWKRDDWSFVTVVVTSDIGGLTEALGAVDYGTCPAETEPWQGGKHDGWSVGMDEIISKHPVPDMLIELKARMRAELPALRDQIDAAIAKVAEEKS